MAEKRYSPLRAIRAKCIDCCCGNTNEVRDCTITECPLYEFRNGHNPNRKGMGNKSPSQVGLLRNRGVSSVAESVEEV